MLKCRRCARPALVDLTTDAGADLRLCAQCAEKLRDRISRTLARTKPDPHQERADREGVTRKEAKRRNWIEGLGFAPVVPRDYDSIATHPDVVAFVETYVETYVVARTKPEPCPICGESPCAGSGAV